MLIPSPFKNYPEGYADLKSLIKAGHKPRQMGFKVDIDEVYRFANRFRLAKAFTGIKLDNYNSNTVLGYDALFQVFLAYSAFELFLKIVGQKQSTIMGIIAKYDPLSHIQYVVRQDKGRLFYSFVHHHVTSAALRMHLTNVYNGNSNNITYLASAVRHIFAYGHLSAHANKCEPIAVKQICDTIFDFHMTVMDNEFSSVVNTYMGTI
jgi:hypothetical protein